MSGWDNLAAIAVEAEQYRQADEDLEANPVECPVDGEPLTTGHDGQPFCRFDGWRPD